MEHSSALELAPRVARLERSSRRDRAIVIALAVLALATAQAPGGGGSSIPLVVRDVSGASATLTAQGLSVRDAAGRERVFMGVDSASQPTVSLSDSGGAVREAMFLFEDVPYLQLFDKAKKERIELRLDANANGELMIRDAAQKIRLKLFRTGAGEPQLALYGSDEKPRAYLGTDDDSPYLAMRDRNEIVRLYAGGYRDHSIGLDLRSAANAVLWKAP